MITSKGEIQHSPFFSQNVRQKPKTNVQRQCANERSSDKGRSSHGSITQSPGAGLGV
tara:strand:+ start:219 stop:389 length:171 start_codon:yes stop_codon:yes gene_type:complete